MKKTYVEPEVTVVALKVRDNVMVNASGSGENILGGGGGTKDLDPEPSGDVYVDARESINTWEEW